MRERKIRRGVGGAHRGSHKEHTPKDIDQESERLIFMSSYNQKISKTGVLEVHATSED